MVVKQELEKQNLHPSRVELGEVTLEEKQLTTEQLGLIDKTLLSLGFERIDDRKGRLIENIRKRVIQLIHGSEIQNKKFNWSKILSDELHYDYNYLSNLFSSTEGITLEQYVIRQKIERAKELLFYDELNLSEIASKLGYSSVAHLSNQFKKITGMTPSALKKTRGQGGARRPIDHIN